MGVRCGVITYTLVLAVGLSGCADTPVSPEDSLVDHGATLQPPPHAQQQGPPVGTGLVLESLTGLSVPIVGEVGEITIDQAVITELALVEDVAGAIIGLEATGTLVASGGVLNDEVVTEDFTTTVGVVSGGPGRCDVVGIDLGPIALDAAVGLVEVDLPEAAVATRGSGALGSLLCNVGSLVDPVTGILGSGVRGLVNAINNLLI